MSFFSGFSLKDDEAFFSAYLRTSSYSVAGFSYGAVNAVEHAASSHERIDLVQLFSPAFFQSRPEKFKRLQMMGYAKNAQAYLEAFRHSCFAPYEAQGVTDSPTAASELESLLYYVWKPELLAKIAARGTRIEVYLGSEDKIIDYKAAREFFTPLATVFTIKNANHFLQTGH